MLDEKGRVQRTRLELGLWFVARDALRAGQLFRPIGGAATPTRRGQCAQSLLEAVPVRMSQPQT